MTSACFNKEYQEKNLASAPPRWRGWLGAMSSGELGKARKIIAGSADVSAQDGAFLLHAMANFFVPSNGAADVLAMAKALSAMKVFSEADRSKIKRDPIRSIIAMAKRSQSPGVASEWIFLAMACASEFRASDRDRARNFSDFLTCGHSRGLRLALDAGAASLPPQSVVEEIFLASFRVAYENSAVVERESERVNAALKIDALFNARVAAPASLSAEEALALLAGAASRNAGKEAMGFLLDRAGSLLASSAMEDLAKICIPQEAKKGRLIIGTRIGNGRPLGAILKSNAWDSKAREAEAVRICKASIERNQSSIFSTAANFCDWSVFSAKAIERFGGGFIAQMERGLLGKASAAPAPASSIKASRSRL